VTGYNTYENNNTSLLGLNVGPIQIYVNGVGTLVPVVWNSDYIKQVVAGTCIHSCHIKPGFQSNHRLLTSRYMRLIKPKIINLTLHEVNKTKDY